MGARKAKLVADEQTADAAAIDDLTGAWNRAEFVSLAGTTFAAGEQHNVRVALAHFEFHFADGPLIGDTDTITDALTSMARQLRAHLGERAVLGRVDTYRLAALLVDYAEDRLPVAEGNYTVIDPAASRAALVLSVAIVHAERGMTIHDLMHQTDLRTSNRKRTGASRSGPRNSSAVPAKPSTRRVKSGR